MAKLQAGSGGTAEIVAYARHSGRWLFWIHAGNGVIQEENRPDNLLGAALADIHIHREYSRNAERYAHMARLLTHGKANQAHPRYV